MPAFSTHGAFEPYLVANEQQPETALFLLPPGNGGAESYLGNLVKHLRETRMVLFNNMHRHKPMSSYEALARYYIGHVRQLQARGPYNLLGWSFGGVLALEMALQLARAGDAVSNLILIDPFFNTNKALADLGLRAGDLDLDPINYAYQPTPADLDRLSARTGNTLLFKAEMLDDDHSNKRQRQLFEYYVHSPSNNLETLLSRRAFSIEWLPHDTHFSWVHSARTVALMAVRIAAQLRGNRTVSKSSISSEDREMFWLYRDEGKDADRSKNRL
jgi:N-(5-amino-5-carboxypentanoyl)-L-cysteinyl-D-valine synthase